MSRIRKAAITAGFSYAQFAIAIASGLVLVPLTLHRVGVRPWGLWLASGELLAHAGMVELGVVGVLPWMLAEADGRGDRDTMRRLVGQGFWIALAVGIGYVGLALAVWTVLPFALRLTPADRAMLAMPLVLVVASNAATYPLRVFRALLTGLQDAQFNGALTLVDGTLTVAITAVLVVKGYGLMALSLGAAVPPMIVLTICFFRAVALAPDLFTGWGGPSLERARPLFTNGVGVWLANIGWQMLASTNATVITILGFPEWVPLYSCTSKLSQVSTQLAWVLPDSGLVGLAQLAGEQQGPEGRGRIRHMVLMMLRLHLLLAGGALCVLLAMNPAFVSRWVGADFFGGLTLNGLLAVGVVVFSLIHGLITTASVLGNRFKVGVVTLVNGAVQVVLALAMGRLWGVAGIAGAGLLAGLLTAAPAGLALLEPATGLTARDLVRELLLPWGVRIAALAALSAGAGLFYRTLGVGPAIAIALVVSALYGWQMRPLYVGLPLDARWIAWLVRVRLMPDPGGPLVGSVEAAERV